VELIGQGIANIVSPLFGGLPATGAIARTATNVPLRRKKRLLRESFIRLLCWGLFCLLRRW